MSPKLCTVKITEILLLQEKQKIPQNYSSKFTHNLNTGVLISPYPDQEGNELQ
jgi:hypothetical protein